MIRRRLAILIVVLVVCAFAAGYWVSWAARRGVVASADSFGQLPDYPYKNDLNGLDATGIIYRIDDTGGRMVRLVMHGQTTPEKLEHIAKGTDGLFLSKDVNHDSIRLISRVEEALGRPTADNLNAVADRSWYSAGVIRSGFMYLAYDPESHIFWAEIYTRRTERTSDY